MNPNHYLTNQEFDYRLKKKSDVTVETLAERDNLPAWVRKWGMIVNVFNDAENTGFYYLAKGTEDITDNTNWKKLLPELVDDELMEALLYFDYGI